MLITKTVISDTVTYQFLLNPPHPPPLGVFRGGGTPQFLSMVYYVISGISINLIKVTIKKHSFWVDCPLKTSNFANKFKFPNGYPYFFILSFPRHVYTQNLHEFTLKTVVTLYRVSNKESSSPPQLLT